MDAALLETLTAAALSAALRSDAADPVVLRLLVRRYAATGIDAIGNALGPALAAALAGDRHGDAAAWLHLWADASEVSDDEGIAPAAAEEAARLRAGWSTPAPLEESMRGLEACLAAAPMLDRASVQAAVDELERLVGARYEPGEGMRGSGLPGQVRSAAALIAGHDATGRLPYAMLADELARFARRRWWRDARGGFEDPDPFAAASCAAGVWCRLAAFDADPRYRSAAVPAPADWAADTDRLFSAHADEARARGAAAAEYALALSDWIGVQKEVE
jgi:hypothetical protein